MIIGLTGPIGSGKSEISKYLGTKGFFVIDCDEIVKNLYVNCNKCIDDIGKNFADVVEDTHINRKKLAEIVFRNKKSLSKLCEVVNPYILERIQNEIDDNNCEHVILDAPTLFESGAYRFCNYSLAILSEKNIRLNRILSREDVSFCDAIRRIDAQPCDDFYIEHADETVFNQGEMCCFIENVENILKKWL